MTTSQSSPAAADGPAPRSGARHWGRWLLAALAVLVLGAALVDWNGIARRWAERTASEKTGRTVRIGDLRLVWWHLPLRVELRDVSVSNPSWATSPVFFDTRLAAVEFRLLPLLLRRELVVPYAELDHPRLFLEQRDDRRTWKFGDGESKKGSFEPAIARAVIRDGAVQYLDPASKTAVDVAFETRAAGAPGNAAASTGAPGSAATSATSTAGDRLVLRATGRFRDEPLTAQATGGSILKLRDDDPYPVSVEGRLGQTALKADGRVANLATLGTFDFDVALSGPTMKAVGDVFDVAIPDTPPYRLSGHLVRRDALWRVERMAGKVGDSDMGGTIQIEPATDARPRPLLTATLVSQTLDFDDLAPLLGSPPSTATGQTASPEQRRQAERQRAKDEALPSKPFDTDRWRKLDAKVSLDSRKVLHAPSLPIDSFSAQFELVDGQGKISPLKMGLAGGQATAHVTLDGRKQPLSGSLRAQFAGLKLDRMFPTVEKMRSSLGTLYGQVDLKSSGGSVKSLMAEADGSVHLAMAGGRISNMLVELAGLDGGEVIKYFVRGDREIRIRCGVADFAVADGVAHARTLFVDTVDSNVIGAGQIDFEREKLGLEFKVRPKDMSILAFRAPLHLTGSLRKPKIAPDTGVLAGKGLAALALGAINPLLALIPTIESGPGEDANCRQLIAEVPHFTAQGALQSAARNEAKLPPDAPRPAPVAPAPTTAAKAPPNSGVNPYRAN